MRASNGRKVATVVVLLFVATTTSASAGKLWGGRSAQVQKIIAEADQFLEAAVELKRVGDENNAQALAHRARLRYEKALRFLPNDVELHYRAFLCATNYSTDRKIEWKSALVHADRIRELNPLFERDVSITQQLPHLLGKALLFQFLPDETKVYRRIVVEYDRLFAYVDDGDGRSQANAHSNVAEIHMALGDLQQAIRHYKLGLTTSGQPELAYYGLALAYERNGQRAFAREAMRKALRLNPTLSTLTGADQSRKSGVYFVPRNDKHAYIALGYDVMGKRDLAATHYQALLDKAPKVRKAYRAVARKRLQELKRQGAKVNRANPVVPDRGFRF